jgi:hypothetical protein
MSRFLVEAKHDNDPLACARVVQVFLATGSHYLTNAEWGCRDGHHATWLMVDADSKEQVRSILPAPFRAGARIVALNRFTPEQVAEIVEQHRP